VSPPMRYHAASPRRDRILAVLQERGFASVADLAQDLGVSDMTVRRDLKQLEESTEVRVVHGGASLPHGTLRSTFAARGEENAVGKRQIAQHAAALIAERDSIAIDAGTTAYEVATSLPDNFAGLVVTNSVPVIQFLLGRPDIRVISLGGELLPTSHAFAGPMTIETAQSLRVRTFFLGAAAIDPRGVYVETDTERPTKLALANIAEQVILLADHTKFTNWAPVRLCPLTKINTLISDQQPPKTAAQALKNSDVRIITPQQQQKSRPSNPAE
jgi:DeoR family transcriptional regulator, fructose operon transcriptional repressor